MTVNNHGILPVFKEAGSTSFQIVKELRHLTKIQKIGHAGTLDPFASGVMIMLIGSEYTKQSDKFLTANKQYIATVHLGITTDTFDIDGQLVDQNEMIPTHSQVEESIARFQGNTFQIPPMFSAKKINGKKLCDLARKGVYVERAPVPVTMKLQLIAYEYPKIKLIVDCSKGTYIRTLAFDLGKALGTGAHLFELVRTRSGSFQMDECIPQEKIRDPHYDITPHLRKL